MLRGSKLARNFSTSPDISFSALIIGGAGLDPNSSGLTRAYGVRKRYLLVLSLRV